MKHSAAGTDTRKPYSGLSRSLVIAIDVGTTFSGVSYAILEPGEIPKIHGVTRFPGQEHVAGNSKIPSLLYYDKHGNVMAAGAEAETASVIAQAEDDGWIKTELFKLRLRPRTMQLNMNGMRLSPLPRRKTPVHVFGDYLAYLYRCTRKFIIDTHANGSALWDQVEPDIQFVLSHPNGWEGPQQTRMRNAAVYGKLVPDTDAGRARIRFVTEGEASLHACVLSGLAADVLSNPSDHGFLIADAGGGTLDISAYAIKGTIPLSMEEIAPPDCIFAGSVFVSRRAREFLEEKLKHSKYGTPDAVDHITRRFDETTKRLFRDRNELQFIPFGSPLDKDPAVGIRSGQLRLTGNEVANLFEPSVDAAVNSIKKQVNASGGMIKSVFLVGGYAASPWLFSQLQERLNKYGITVSRPDTQTSKAVADGAIGFYCDHHVSARMSKFMYGVEFLRELDPKDPDHVARQEKLCELPSGPKLLPDAFDCILARSVKVKESTVFTRKYCTELTNLSMLSVFEVEIWCYRGGNTIPKWIDRHNDAFSTLCVVQADLSLLSGSAEPKIGKNAKKYWTIVFSVEIHFGLTEFRARIKWMDNGQVKYGPAVIVYNERGHRIEDDDIDSYPEDDSSSMQQSSRSERDRSDRSSRTPVDSYPQNGGSSSSRRSSVVPESIRGSSKAYSPSIAPSHRSTARESHRNSDSERNGSDSDRRRERDRDREYHDYHREDRDRGFRPSSGAATPNDRRSAYGAPSIAASNSNGPVANEMLSAGRELDYTVPSSRSPSIQQQPRSRTTSVHIGGATPIPGDYPPSPQGFSGPPRSAIDEHRQSHLWDAPPIPASPANGARSIIGSPKSAFTDRPRSVAPQDSWGQPEPAAQTPHIEQVERSRTPFAQEHLAGIGRTGSPFIDRPKSGVESFYERPKSAFGHGPSVFDNEPPPPAMFGDAGPAADVGNSASLFGDPPAALFGETPAANSWEMPAQIHPAPAATDGWSFAPPATVTETPAPATPASAGSGKKGKRKGSAATPAAAAPTPAAVEQHTSIFGNNSSPAFGGNKSPFGNAGDTLHTESPIVAAAAPAISPSPSFGNGGSLGSKVPSPLSKPLSPLNPASQFGHDTQPATNNSNFDWGWDNNAGGDAVTGDSWDNVNMNDPPPQEEIRVPSPVPPPSAPVEVVPSPVEEVKETTIGKKKKKKASGAVTPSKSAWEQEEEARKAEEAMKAEEEKLRKELEELENAAQAEREEQERKDKEEQERKDKEEQERKDREEQERKDKEQKEKEEQEKAAAAAASFSVFGNTTPLTSDTGGGDDSWGSSWGATTTSKKKKGAKTPTTSPLSTKPSVFGSGGGWGGGFGTTSAFGTGLGATASPKPSPKLTNVELPATDTWNLGSAAPNLNFSFDANKPPSPAPAAVEEFSQPQDDPIPAATETAEATIPETPAETEPETTVAGKKKKKKKGTAGALDTPNNEPETPVVETPAEEAKIEEPPLEAPAVEEQPPAAEPETAVVPEPTPTAAAGGAAKKKKKKK